VNDDGEAHAVTAVDKSFDSAGLDSGDACTHSFTKPGTYAYFCALHPYMKGVIVVRATGGTTP
jgi:plastocyanin